MSEFLAVGDSSPRVAQARAALIGLGLLKNTPSGGTDAVNVFDAELERAVRAFQQERGIVANGQINDTTLRMLQEASYTLGARVLTYQPDNPFTGDDVTSLQDQLHELGFYTGRIDGSYGPDTHEAVCNYQLNYGLDVDGVCGEKTVQSLGYLGLRIKGGSLAAIREREQVRQAGPRLAGKRVVIDPALGGQRTGLTVTGPFGTITEEEILWDLANRVYTRMVAAGVETILSRPRMSDPSHEDRASLANAYGADLMISLQCDAYPNDKASGCATFYFGSEMGASSVTGQSLSGIIQREIAARTDLVNCGNHARTWDILRLTNMPTVEVVAGYLTNPGDVAVLTDPNMRDTIAEAIVVAVKRLYLLEDDDQPTGTYSFSALLKEELL